MAYVGRAPLPRHRERRRRPALALARTLTSQPAAFVRLIFGHLLARRARRA
jgi:hypothetical protein